ncbi:uncharacterized protein N0V89_006507 [Didymosphaeria variabile]|uniref:Protein kinase domain-containing protein n=1 Tax=Didymosphaeria variabile TaxID=1932322 RepID=A0A9W8XJ79_9PLEO|nr:uncharacterized protein N0V89_006507 [Didymosphaeria variabile]KAJ4351168.1 hypothetical protein N0V89_006507 [Didymosphaeria variabile]
MKRLQDVPADLRSRFTEPLEFSEEDRDNGLYWYSMKAVNGFTLAQLRNTAIAGNIIIPQELVFHVYLQLNQALHFLHTSDPPMAKGDLIAVNVMVDPTNQDTPGFPNVKLIDFGGATVGGSYAKNVIENADFPDADKEKNRCVHEIEFTDFVDALGYRLAVLGLDTPREYLEIDLQERLPKVLKIKRDYTSAENLQAIDCLVKETQESSGNKFPTDQQILDAVGQEDQAYHIFGRGRANDTPTSRH